MSPEDGRDSAFLDQVEPGVKRDHANVRHRHTLGQRIFVVEREACVYLVPFVEDEHTVRPYCSLRKTTTRVNPAKLNKRNLVVCDTPIAAR